MGFISSRDGSYYEGDREHALDLVVPQRPSLDYKFAAGVWVFDPQPAPQNGAALEQRMRDRKREEIATALESEPLSEGLRGLLKSMLDLTGEK